MKKTMVLLLCGIFIGGASVFVFQNIHHSEDSIINSNDIIDVSESIGTFDITHLDFNKMDVFLGEIPKNGECPGYMMRGMSEQPLIAFFDYSNNNIYTMEYEANKDFKNMVFLDEIGLLIINKISESIDVISTNEFKPTLKQSANVKNIESFIGADYSNNLIFVKTTDNNLYCYNYATNTIHDYSIEGNRFKEIYDSISEEGEVVDFFFHGYCTKENGEKYTGVLIRYFKDGVLHKKFYEYIPSTHTFNEIINEA